MVSHDEVLPQGGQDGGAVVLLNMGGPDSIAAIQPFLRNLFSDPEILGVPAFVRLPLARFLAARRSRKVTPSYQAIGGKSPLMEITLAQARALEELLVAEGAAWSVHVAMRYWKPFADDAVAEIHRRGGRRIVVLPLYPQYCRATTGSSIADFEAALRRGGLGVMPRTVIRSWQDHPAYLDAVAETISEGLARMPDAHLLFSAHGLPVSIIEGGDPYLDHVTATMSGVMARMPDVPHHLAFQSRAGPVKWLEPSTGEMLRTLAKRGVRQVLVVPVSFVSDHIETLHEIDIEYAAEAQALGFQAFRRVASLNTRPAFVRALAELVLANSH